MLIIKYYLIPIEFFLILPEYFESLINSKDPDAGGQLITEYGSTLDYWYLIEQGRLCRGPRQCTDTVVLDAGG